MTVSLSNFARLEPAMSEVDQKSQPRDALHHGQPPFAQLAIAVGEESHVINIAEIGGASSGAVVPTRDLLREIDHFIILFEDAVAAGRYSSCQTQKAYGFYRSLESS